MLSLTLLFLACIANIANSATDNRLWNAVSNGNSTLVEEILKQKDYDPLHFGRLYLEIAAQNSLYNRERDTLNDMSKHIPDILKDVWEYMFGYVNPYVHVIEVLLKYGADPYQRNDEGRTAYEHYMQYVVWYPNPEIERLLNPEILTQEKLQLGFYYAVWDHDLTTMGEFLQLGADPTILFNGKTFCDIATHNGFPLSGSPGNLTEVLKMLC